MSNNLCESCGVVTKLTKETEKRDSDAVFAGNANIQAALTYQIEQVMKRAWLLLEDKEWNNAEAHFNSALSLDAEHAHAYIGLLCVDLKLQEEGALSQYNKPIDDHKLFKKGLRFANDEYRNILERYSESIKESIKRRQEEKKKELKQHLAEKK